MDDKNKYSHTTTNDMANLHTIQKTSPIHTLLLTGAAGSLGKALRPRLANICTRLRLSDVTPIHNLTNDEEFIACDLSQTAAVLHLCEGVDAILHFGGISLEGPFEPILQANILGSYNVYEAARQHGITRIIFASSNHVTGFYPQDETVSIHSQRRPDGFYGISKAFTEDLANYYYDRWGIESLCIRIGSSFPQPKDHRMLSTWLSYDDLTQLIHAGLTTPNIGCQLIYGVSANTPRWWSTEGTEKIPFHPLSSTDSFKAEIATQPLPPPGTPNGDTKEVVLLP
ncbi:NAD-dependent epimerase/dehydratase family protein [Paenalcaligenes niemegkensis]|uniref:NAD-dependent epimerase/dehydratase family protein n=1 Tax=Paenalcaligenes niemegkensis TaxID=2895469 RepID=UPI0027E32CFA|nr:NAD(P)-dependent oxidoreductase [Paenalcaligenes niemegkensis]